MGGLCGVRRGGRGVYLDVGKGDGEGVPSKRKKRE